MKAITYKKYGGPEVFTLSEMPKPTPKANEVLIKIKASTVTSGDRRIRQADPNLVRLFYGLRKPKNSILGHELAGVVEAVGTEVSRFKVGDKIFGTTGFASGTYAEYIALPETATLELIPEGVDFQEAAALPMGAMTALHFLRKSKLQKGMHILIHGASGSVGTAAVQLAKYLGAKVTAVCSTRSLKMVEAMGADQVIDYTQEDFAENEFMYDVVFNVVGKTSYPIAKKVLKKGGVYIASDAPLSDYFQTPLAALFNNHQIIAGVASESTELLMYLKHRVEEGNLKAVLDRSYPLEEMAVAHQYVDTGHKKGNVVIEVS